MSTLPLDHIELFGDVNGQRTRLAALNIGLTLYFPIPISSCLDAIHHLFDTYISGTDWTIFKVQNLSGTAKGYKKKSASARPTIADWMEGKRSFGNACCVWLSDQTDATSAGNHVFELFGREIGTKEFDSNFLRILFPHDILYEKGVQPFLDWISNMLADLPFYSGHLGYTLGTSTLLQVSPYSTLLNERLYAVGRHFVGIEIEKPHLENYDMKRFCRPPSWITFLSDEMIGKLGGLDAVENIAMDSSFSKVGAGWRIRSGDLPDIGDRNRQADSLTAQRTLANVLQPLYSPMPAKLFSNKEYEATIEWLHRLKG